MAASLNGTIGLREFQIAVSYPPSPPFAFSTFSVIRVTPEKEKGRLHPKMIGSPAIACQDWILAGLANG